MLRLARCRSSPCCRLLRHRRVVGSPARVHAPYPPSSMRTSGWPKYSRNQNARAARMPDCSSYTTTGTSTRHAPRCEQVLDDPEERLQRRFIGVHGADAEQVEVNGARQMPGRKGLRRPQNPESSTFFPSASSLRQLRRPYEKRGHVRNYILASPARGSCGGTGRKNPCRCRR